MEAGVKKRVTEILPLLTMDWPKEAMRPGLLRESEVADGLHRER